MSQPLVEGRRLQRVFSVRGGLLQPHKTLRAVDDVSLAIQPGETVALVGESGSGKSTLGRLLLGLLEPTAGDVLYEGEPLRGLRGERWRTFRREAQVVFQDASSSLNPRKTVGASLEVPLKYNLGLPKRHLAPRASDLLRRVGLDPGTFYNRYPHELSGGQRQRVGIARAVASEPRLVVADEPVSALDVSVRAQVLKLMRDLQRESGLAYLFITHDLGVVRAVADRVLVMYLGSLVEEGPVSRIFTRPGHPYTRALLTATPVPDPARRHTISRALRGDIPSPTNPPPGCRFHPRCPLAQDICRTTPPPLLPLDDNAAAACHFAREVQAMPLPGHEPATRRA